MSRLTYIDRMDRKSTGMADDCRSSVNRQLVDYLRRLENRLGRKPGWPDVELMDVYKIAPSIVVRDVLDGGREFRIRFWGTEMAVALEFDATGMLLSDIDPPEMIDIVRSRYDEIVATGRSWAVSGTLTYVPNKDYKTFELVHLPLWGDAGAVSHIISSYDWNFQIPDQRAR